MQARILVATDGEPAAAGAIRLARITQELHGAYVEVVAVHEPIPLLAGVDDPLIARHLSYESEAVAALRRKVEAQLAGAGVPAGSWPVRVRSGPAAPIIARAAVERHATLLVLGLRRYDARDHRTGRETPLRVTHLAHVPVLAVPPETESLPRTALVATDFGGLSVRAAEAARVLVGPEGRIHLVHVAPERPQRHDPTTLPAADPYAERLASELARLAMDLEGATGGRTRVHLLSGDPAPRILALAADVHAELIAAGSQSYGLLGRLLSGHVASRLMRAAHCPVLIAPPTQVAPELRLDLTEAELLGNLGVAGEVAIPASPAATAFR